LNDFLHNIHYTLGKTREEAIKNKSKIKRKIQDYLLNNPIYTEDNKIVTVNTHNFYYDGVVLLGDDDATKKEQIKDLKTNFPQLIWSTVTGVIGAGLVYLYGKTLYNVASDIIDYPPNGVNYTTPSYFVDPTTAGIGFPTGMLIDLSS
jgi:hypothetical protein